MPTPPPDPSGRPSSAKRAPAGAPDELSGPGHAEPASKASTNSHYPLPAASSVGPAPAAIGSDVFRILSDPTATPDPVENTDDSPTVITRGLPDQPPPPPPLTLLAGDPPMLAGRRLGNYELIEAVGAGGMAAVLKARDLELGRVVALKILPPAAARDPEGVTRFKQEARAAALLDHENVARVYACGEDQGLYFIAFEFVEGINLRQMIDRRGAIPAAEAVRYMIQVAAGLAHAAERGVVHRDIKPSNILITPDHRAKIVDMGLARQLEASANGGVTQSGVTLGTFDYISPEQALDPRRADVRSDIYSLGCAFYHALTGRPPVPEGTAARKLHAHQHTDPLDPRAIRADIPDELVVVLARMMAKDPARRYQTPEELIAHLKGLAERLHLADASGQDSVVRAVRAESPLRPPQLRLGWVLAAAAVAVAVAAFALSTADRGGVPTPPPWADDARLPKVDPVAPPAAGVRPAPGAPADDGVVRTAQQLADRLAAAGADDVTRVDLAPGVIDLTQLDEPVVFRGKRLELVGSASRPTVLKLYPSPMSTPTETPAGALAALGAGSVEVKWVRFAAAYPADEDGWDTAWASLVAADVGTLNLIDCVFQSIDTARLDGMGGVRVVRGGPVRAERCAFAPASFALWLPDGCRATVFDCGFGPHDAAVRVGDGRSAAGAEVSPPNGAVALERSSFLLDPTAAVLTNLSGADGGGIDATAEYCVFAASLPIDPLALVPGAAAAVRRPAVVRAAAHPEEVRFAGKGKNAYYGVAALALQTDRGEKFYTFEQCREKQFPVADSAAVELARRPWAEADPLRALANGDPWRAFGLRPAEPLATGDKVHMVGAQFDSRDQNAHRAYPDVPWPPAFPKAPASQDGNQLVWFPDAPRDETLPKYVSPYLEVLLREARPGSEILIRHTGLLPVEKTVELEKLRGAEFRVTFKPDRGHAPVLAASADWNRLDQSLFRQAAGKVTFQGVQFLLKPTRPRDGQTAAAVAVVGGECVFEDCVFTLAEEDASKAAAVVFPDAAMMMALDGTPRPAPRAEFRRCVIRGKGQGVWAKASGPVQVSASQSLTAIDGPLLLVEPGGRPTPGTRSSLNLSRVTAFAGGPLVEMRGGKTVAKAGTMPVSGLPQLDVHADGCLFAAVPGAGRPLVELDGVDPDEAMKLLPWAVDSTTPNWYANFDRSATVMIVRPTGEGVMPRESGWDEWVAFAREPAAGGTKRVGRVVFENAPSGLSALAAVRPADAAVRSLDFPDVPAVKPADVGAAADKLPVPVTPE